MSKQEDEQKPLRWQDKDGKWHEHCDICGDCILCGPCYCEMEPAIPDDVIEMVGEK